MLSRINPENIPDWTVFAFAGFLVGTTTFGVFLMTPEPVAEPSCDGKQQTVFLPDTSVAEPPKSALERPQEDWLWQTPEDAETFYEEPGTILEEPRRRRHRRRG